MVDMEGLLIYLAIGAGVGWLAGNRMKEGGFGLLGNIMVSIIGGVVGGFFFRFLLMIAGGLVGSIVTAALGAAGLLIFVGQFKKSKTS